MTDRNTVALAVLLTLAVALAGCVGGGGSASDGDGTTTDDEEQTTNGNTTTGDGDDRAHVHDRWDGAETMSVIGGQTVTLSVVDPEETDGTDSCVNSGDSACFGGEEVPPDGIVAPGTGWVNVTVEFPEDEFDRIEVLYQDAFTSRWSTAGQVGSSGGTASVQIQDVRQTDDGHAEVSRWRFAVQARGNPNGLPYEGPASPSGGDVTVTAEAIRASGPLPLEPPHPDYFVNTTVHRVSYIEGSVQQMVQVGPAVVEQGNGEDLPASPFAEGILWRSNPGLTGHRATSPPAERDRLDHPHDVALVPPSSSQLIALINVQGETTAGAEICLYGAYEPGQLLGDQLGCLDYSGGEDEVTIERGLDATETDTPYTDHTGGNSSRWTFWLEVSAQSAGGQDTVGDFGGSVQVALFATEDLQFSAPSWAFEV